jgi:hypothetical protein
MLFIYERILKIFTVFFVFTISIIVNKLKYTFRNTPSNLDYEETKSNEIG